MCYIIMKKKLVVIIAIGIVLLCNFLINNTIGGKHHGYENGW